MLHLCELQGSSPHLCCLERQRGCGKIGLLLRPLSLPSMRHVLHARGCHGPVVANSAQVMIVC